MVDRQANFDDRDTSEDTAGIFIEDESIGGSDSPANPAAYAIFQRYIHDASMNIELAVESEALDGHEWHRLNRQLSYISNIAGLFGKIDLGLLAGELAKGLEILTPRARVRRLRNARNEFTRLAVRNDRTQV